MKKKLLFVIPALDLGGAEKSFVNLLNVMDFERYEVDVFLLTRTGFFLNNIPAQVHVLPQSADFTTFSKPFFSSLFSFLVQAKLNLLFQKLRFTLLSRSSLNSVLKEQRSWKYLKHFFTLQPKHYDVAVAYLEKTSGYYVIDKTKASKKIGWIHTDLEKLGIDFQLELPYLERFDFLVTVSDGLSERLQKKIPQLANRIKTVENINSKIMIGKLAEEKPDIIFPEDRINLLYVGRLAQEKGLFNALDAVEILIKKKHNVHWYLIGSGDQETELQRRAVEKGILENVHFLGTKANPYPYLKASDIFILTSFIEGKSISLEEAKLLHKPIVVTNFSSAKDQIDDRHTGLIAEMNGAAVAEKIELLINNDLLMKKLSKNLKDSAKGNEQEIEKFYNLIGE